MPTQFSFDGMEPPGPPVSALDPLIFVVRPDAVARQHIADRCRTLAMTHGLTGRPTEPARLHITLQWMPFERNRVEEFAALAPMIVSGLDIPPFEVTLSEALSFNGAPGNYPFVLRAENGALLEVFNALGAGMRRVGLGKFVKRSFTPHLTLLYDRVQAPPEPIEPVRWMATELVLIHSVQGQSRHDVLAGWPLATRS